MEKLSLDTDSPIRGDYKRDMETHTPVRQAQKASQGAFLYPAGNLPASYREDLRLLAVHVMDLGDMCRSFQKFDKPNKKKLKI